MSSSAPSNFLTKWCWLLPPIRPKSLFSIIEQRKALAEEAFADFKGSKVRVTTFRGLLIDYVLKREIQMRFCEACAPFRILNLNSRWR